MSDLFLAGFNRLWRSRVFQVCCLVSFAANVFVMLATYRQVLNYTELGLEHSITLDSVFYGLVPVLGVMCAAFVSLFIGTEHSDGVMRNMLVVGRARWEIYLANYAVCFVGTAAFLVCWFLGGLVGIPLIGVWQDVNGMLLGCAVLFSFQIMAVDHYSPLVDGVRLSLLEFLVTAIESTLAAFLFETPTLADFAANAWPIVFCGVFSSGVAYTLQILGQKDLNPAIASLIMCLESVFSAIGGWLILHQSLSAREGIGCALIFTAVVLAQLPLGKRAESAA